jgi:hypothetical protein
MEQQFVVTHTIRKTTLLGHKHTSVRMKLLALISYFRKNMTCLAVGFLRIGHVFSVLCKTVYRWVTNNCCFMSVTLILRDTTIPRA